MKKKSVVLALAGTMLFGVAAGGFYMIALNPGDQALFVGIRSTFYRLSGIVFCPVNYIFVMDNGR